MAWLEVLDIKEWRLVPVASGMTMLIKSHDHDSGEITYQEIDRNGRIIGSSIFSDADPERHKFEDIYRRTHKLWR